MNPSAGGRNVWLDAKAKSGWMLRPNQPRILKRRKLLTQWRSSVNSREWHFYFYFFYKAIVLLHFVTFEVAWLDPYRKLVTVRKPGKTGKTLAADDVLCDGGFLAAALTWISVWIVHLTMHTI